jgi:hypothetical protein
MRHCTPADERGQPLRPVARPRTRVISEDRMDRYQLNDFPFENPDIARALSHALAALLWNTPPPAPPSPPQPKRRVRRKQPTARTRQLSTTEAEEQRE